MATTRLTQQYVEVFGNPDANSDPDLPKTIAITQQYVEVFGSTDAATAPAASEFHIATGGFTLSGLAITENNSQPTITEEKIKLPKGFLLMRRESYLKLVNPRFNTQDRLDALDRLN